MKKFLLLVLIVAVPFAHADNSKISPDLQNYPSNQQAQVIVQYAPGTQVNCSGLLGLVECLVNDVVQLGGTILSDLPLVNGVVAVLDGNGIVSLSNQSNIVYISLDRPLAPTLSNAAYAVNAPFAWQSNYTGAGIGVALIDSGVSNHPDLYTGILPFSRVVYQQSFVPGNSSASDQYGHGTHVAGLIAGDGLDSTGPLFNKTFKGIAPSANIVNLRVLDQNGEGTDSLVIAAINQAISLKSRYNIRVINLSLGRAVYETYTLDPLCQAVEQAWKNGIVVVVAAGNNGRYQPTDGYATVTSPGNDPYVITVGAMKPMGTPTRVDDLIASYSSKGPSVVDAVVKPDIVAPGNLLTSLEAPNSTLYNEYPSNQVPYSYYVNGEQCIVSELLHPQWNQYGCGHCQRRGRGCAAAESETHSRPGEGPADADGIQDVPAVQQHDRSNDWDHLYRPIRRIHRRRRLRGRRGCAEQHRSRERDGDVSDCHFQRKHE